MSTAPHLRLHKFLSQPTTTGCLEFVGDRNRGGGYGRLRAGGVHDGYAMAHRVAWEAVHGPIPEGVEVCHHCDNPPCCNVDHLFLGTHKQNMNDRDAKGRNPRGTRIGSSKLSEAEVVEIRRRYGPGITQRELGEEFGVHQTTVHAIVHRQNWAWLP